MAATRDFLWIGGGRVVTALVALASIRLSTALLPPEQYGVLSLLVTFQVFCGLFLVNPVGQYINRHTHAWADDGTLLPRLARYRAWVIVAALAGALASGLWALSKPVAWSERLLVMATVTLMVVAATWNATSVSLLNMLGHRAQSVGWGAATVLLALALSYAFTLFAGGGLAWFGGQALGMGIGAVGAGIAVRRVLGVTGVGLKPDLRGSGSRAITLLEGDALRGYILPLAVATGFMWWLLSGYRLLVEAHWGLVALGYAAVGLTLASQLWGLVESLAMQFLFPLFYRRIATPDSPDGALAFPDLLNTLGPVYLVLAAATLAGAPALLALLVDAAYADVVPFVLIGAAIECGRVLGNVLATAAQVDRRMSALVLPYAAGALAMTAGVAWVASSGGDITQAVAMLAVAGAVTLATMAHAMRRLHAFRLDGARWSAALMLAVVTAWLAVQSPWVPSGVAAALGIVAVIGAVSAVSLAALLWKNPATARLLAVRLQPDPQGQGVEP